MELFIRYGIAMLLILAVLFLRELGVANLTSIKIETIIITGIILTMLISVTNWYNYRRGRKKGETKK